MFHEVGGGERERDGNEVEGTAEAGKVDRKISASMRIVCAKL